MVSMKNHIREALLTAALFGSVGTTLASASDNSRGVASAPSPKVPGRGIEEPVATPADAAVVLANDRHDVTQSGTRLQETTHRT